jgi:Holliday junction resolvase RusA-like endonuclease
MRVRVAQVLKLICSFFAARLSRLSINGGTRNACAAFAGFFVVAIGLFWWHTDGMSITEIEDIVTFTVPGLTPPSCNHIYKTCYYTGRDGFGHRGKKLSPEAKAYKYAVAIFARGRTVAPESLKDRKKARYRVQIDVYLGKGQRLDGDNAGKVGVDALVYAGVIHADHRVQSHLIPHDEDRANPRTEYTVERLEP